MQSTERGDFCSVAYLLFCGLPYRVVVHAAKIKCIWILLGDKKGTAYFQRTSICGIMVWLAITRGLTLNQLSDLSLHEVCRACAEFIFSPESIKQPGMSRYLQILEHVQSSFSEPEPFKQPERFRYVQIMERHKHGTAPFFSMCSVTVSHAPPAMTSFSNSHRHFGPCWATTIQFGMRQWPLAESGRGGWKTFT